MKKSYLLGAFLITLLHTNPIFVCPCNSSSNNQSPFFEENEEVVDGDNTDVNEED